MGDLTGLYRSIRPSTLQSACPFIWFLILEEKIFKRCWPMYCNVQDLYPLKPPSSSCPLPHGAPRNYYVELSGATIFLDGFSGLFLSSASQEHWYKTCTGCFLSNPPFPSHRVHLPHVPHCRAMRPFFWYQIRSINHTLKCPRLVLIRETLEGPFQWNLLSQYGPSQHPAACALSLLVIGWSLSVGLYRILRSKMDAFRKLCSFWSKSLRSRLTFTLLSGGVFVEHTTSVKNNNRLGADPFLLLFFSSFFW